MGHGEEVAFFPMPQGLGGATSTTHSRELSFPPISMNGDRSWRLACTIQNPKSKME
ncbi:hypothetical protein [Nostoc sp.]